MLTFHQMRALVEIARNENIARAAMSLRAGQPALSRLLRQVETELGVQLFIRTGRGVTPTEAGREVVAFCEETLERFERLRGSLEGAGGALRGHVSIAMPTSVARIAMAPLARAAKRQMPQARLQVLELFTGDVVEAVAEGRIDVGVFYDTSRVSRAVSERAVLDDLYLVAAPDHPLGPEITLRDAVARPLLLPTRPDGVRGLFDRAVARARLTTDIRMEVDATVALLDMVREGEGAALFSYSLVRREAERGEVAAARVVAPTLTREVWVATAAARPPTATVRAVARLLRGLLIELAPEARWRRIDR